MSNATFASDRSQANRRRKARLFREFLRNPAAVGALSPSGPALSRRMVHGLPLGAMRCVLEFGPGTGVFTEAVVDALPAGWLDNKPTPAAPAQNRAFISIEYNPTMAKELQQKFPGVRVVCDDAENVEAIVAAHGFRVGEVDAIVSGLAWTNFSDEKRVRMLAATHRVLRPGAEFRTFTYHVSFLLRGAWHFKSQLKRTFGNVRVSRVVWKNMPPAFVYTAVK